MGKFLVELRRNRDYIRWIFSYLKQLLKTRRFPDWQRIKCDRSYIQQRLYDALRREGYKVKAEYEAHGYKTIL